MLYLDAVNLDVAAEASDVNLATKGEPRAKLLA
jgi:hypothetical protein